MVVGTAACGPGADVRGSCCCAGVVMVLPFPYLLTTSFKPQAFALAIPPRLLPHHPRPPITRRRGVGESFSITSSTR